MKHKLFTTLAIGTILLSNTAFADTEHHREGENIETKQSMMMSGNMPMMDMKKMHQHMTAMQQMMQEIHGLKDPIKQEKLMSKHMEKMHQGMEIMHGMMSGGKKHGEAEVSNQMMMQRMDMMQGMMRQMMEHMMMQQKMQIK